MGDLFEYERPDKYIVNSDQYSSNGIPVLTANKSFILGYTHENNVYNKGKSIIFDDFTLDMKFVNFPYKVKSSAIKILTAKNNINLRFGFELLQHTKFTQEGHARHYISIVQPTKVKVPIKAEQIQLSNLSSIVDSLIAANEQDQKQTFKITKNISSLMLMII